MRQSFRITVQMSVGILGLSLFAGTAFADEMESGWIAKNGKHYFYLDNGEMAVGEQTIDGITYLFAPNGAQQLGWQTIGENRYYYDVQTGEAVFGFLQWHGESYYISAENGKCTGYFDDGSHQFYGDESGVLVHDIWLQDENGLHYANTDCTLATGEVNIDNCVFLFNENGIMQTGFQIASDGMTRYYLAEENGGAIQKDWFTVNEQTFFADEAGCIYKGIMQTAEGIIGFDENGAQCSGWNIFGNDVYYFDEEKKAVQGINVIENETYYFNDEGIMQTNTVYFDEKSYYFDSDGKLFHGFLETEQGTAYYSPDTGVQVFGWQEIEGSTYYFEESGYMAVGSCVIDGINYHFLENGIYKPVKICLDAGHYAKYNHSPVNSAYWESDFNWKLHLYLKDELEKYGIEVITTREDKDTDLALADRGKTSEGCDLFLSLHSNASNNAYDDGPLACCTVTGVCNELGLDLANLIADVMDTRQGGSIWNRYSGVTPGADYYGVLRAATAVGTPAILLEHSYHTNLRATNWLLVDENVKKLAVAEGEFLARYFDMIP